MLFGTPGLSDSRSAAAGRAGGPVVGASDWDREHLIPDPKLPLPPRGSRCPCAGAHARATVASWLGIKWLARFGRAEIGSGTLELTDGAPRAFAARQGLWFECCLAALTGTPNQSANPCAAPIRRRPPPPRWAYGPRLRRLAALIDSACHQAFVCHQRKCHPNFFASPRSISISTAI
jgi:hypothetical protein